MQQTIYKKDSKGNIRFLTISTEGSTLFQESGIVGTDNPILHSKVCKAKNIGKGNETTPEEQSVLEAVAIVKDKLTKGYSLSIEETNTVDIILPQLAKDYFKEKHKINFSKDVVLVQPKLDGCLVAGSMIKTDKGFIRIAEIVDKQLDVKVLSYNEMTKENEYKRVVNWFNNGSTSTTNFRELVFEDGSKLKCTLNHKFLTETGWKELRNINVFSEKVMKLNMNVKQAVILGSFLGDGNIYLDKRSQVFSARFSFSNSVKQEEYFTYKANLLDENHSVREHISGYGSEMRLYTMTGFSKYYDFARMLLNEDGTKKVLSDKFLSKHLGLLGLAIWIGDDGSVRLNNNNNYSPVLSISTHSFCPEQMHEYVSFFKKEYGCEPTIIRDKRVEGSSIVFNTKDTLYLLNRLRGHIPKGVEYKFYFTRTETPSNLDTQGFTAIKNIRGVTGVKLVKYDIEVEGNHNYYAEDILVHNCRALAFVKSTGEVELISRAGKRIENMMHIEKELSDLGIDIILDGELYVHGESFQTNMSYVKKYYPVKSERILFNVYDVVDKDNPYLERTEILKTLNLKSVQRLPYFRVFNEEEITEFYRQFIREGYEGLMVKVSNLGYKSNARISELLKYKQFIDIQLPILDVIPADQRPDWGTPIYYWDGAKDNILKSGTKMTHEQRKDLLENKQDYVGKYAEIRFFEYSVDNSHS